MAAWLTGGCLCASLIRLGFLEIGLYPVCIRALHRTPHVVDVQEMVAELPVAPFCG